MKLNPTAFGLALGAATAVLWTICSLIVVLIPGFAMNMTGHMMHADLGSMMWTMNITGYLIGLFIWGASACITGWITGVCYNKIAASED